MDCVCNCGALALLGIYYVVEIAGPSAVVLVELVDELEYLVADEVIVGVHIQDNILGETVLPNCHVSVKQGEHSLGLLNYRHLEIQARRLAVVLNLLPGAIIRVIVYINHVKVGVVLSGH